MAEVDYLSFSGVTAAADLSTTGQYLFVKITANRAVNLCTVHTDRPLGILMNKPKLGQPAEVAYLGIVKVTLNATLAAHAEFVTDASGKAIAPVTGDRIMGELLENGVAGDVVAAKLYTMGPISP